MAKEAYQCRRCDGVYEQEIDAEECCGPTVKTVYVCDRCKDLKKHYRTQKEADACQCRGKNDGPRCLCGEFLKEEDERPSMYLGSLVRCSPCREKLLRGVPSGEAARMSFAERLGC
jgi:hypothetical protein